MRVIEMRDAESACATVGCRRMRLQGERYCLTCSARRGEIERLLAAPGPALTPPRPFFAPGRAEPRGTWVVRACRRIELAAELVFVFGALMLIWWNLFPFFSEWGGR